MRTLRRTFPSAVVPQQLAGQGLADVLLDIGGLARWTDGGGNSGQVLEIDASYSDEVWLGGRGLDLLPSPHWIGPPILAEAPGRPVFMIYGSSGAASGADAREIYLGEAQGECGAADGLTPLLGRTRAVVLRELILPRRTGQLAAGLRISEASASEHARALRAAGLVESVREGRSVEHRLTALGQMLLEANPAAG